MSRNITVTFADGSKHVYRGAPDDVTPEQITQRAQQEFGKEIAALDGGRKASVDTANLRPADARNARAQGSAELERQIAHLPPEAQAIGRQKFNADPRVNALAQAANRPQPSAPQERSVLNDLWTATQQRGAAAVKGLGGFFDLPMQAATGVERVVTNAIGTGGGAVLDAVGLEGAADWWRGGAESADQQLARTPTIRAGVERVVAPPTDTAGKVADFATEMLVGAAVPIPGAKPPVRAPAPVAAKTAAQQVVDDAEQAGVRVLTSDVKPPQNFVTKTIQTIGERIPFAGTGGVRQSQQAQRIDAVKTLARDYGLDDAGALVDDVAKDFAKTRGDTLSRLTTAKDSVIDNIPGAVSAPNAIKAIDEQIARLKGINDEAFAPVVAKLEGFKQQLASGKDLRQIEGNRKLLGDLFSDPSLASIKGDGQKALNAIYGPLKADMAAFIEANGGKAALAKWKTANERLASMAGELSSSRFRNVLQSADSTPENVANLLFSAKPSEVRRIYSNLSASGRVKAQAAVLQRAIEKAGGLDNISPDQFATQLDKLGKSVGVVFQGPELARIEGLSRVLNATRRAQVAAAAPPTGVQNSIPILAAVLTDMFGSAGAAITSGTTYGLLARAYESAPVRNALLRVARAPAGSPQAAVEMNRAASALTAVLGSNAQRFMPALEQSPVRAAARDEEQDAGVEPPKQ